MGAKINCSICGKPTDSSMENCPHCGSPVTVGRPLPDVTPAVPVRMAAQESCPSCGAAVQDGDIVCVRCGVSLLTGQRVVQKQPRAEAPERGNTRAILAGLGVLALVVILGVVAFVVLRDPVNEARKMARSGDLLGAANLLQKHTGDFPEDGAAFALLGRVHMQTQQFPEASSAFDKAAQLKPGDEELSFLAVVAAGKVPGEAGEQRQLNALKHLVKNHPDNARALKMLALAEGASGATQESAATLDQYASADSSLDEVAKYKGVVSAIAGKYTEARASLAAAGAGDPDVRVAEGYLSSLEGESFAAADALSAVVGGGGPVDGEARTRLGLLYMAQGNFDQALPLLRPTDTGRPSDSARFFYALCQQTAGLGDEALLDFERLVSGEGKFAEDAAVQMAIIYLERNQVDRAAEATRKARKFGSSARLFTIEGQIAAVQGNDTGAQDDFRKAIQANADYPAAHLEHGLMYVKRGALSEGVRELERYLELADAAVPGGRVNEVGLLVKQLQQAVDRDRGSS